MFYDFGYDFLMKHILLSFVLVITFSFSAFADKCVSGDCRNGYGTYVWDNGDKYVGESKDNLLHGQGTLIYAHGDQYVGGFKNDEKHGQGTFTWADGDKYVGGHKNDKRNGQGTFTYNDGRILRGIWKNGELETAN